MKDRQRLRQLRRKVEARLEELEVPAPFDVTLLCERLAARRGRPIRLRAETMGAGPAGCGPTSAVSTTSCTSGRRRRCTRSRLSCTR